MEFINNWINQNHSEGKCLDSFYINSRTKMNWECKENHQWQATFHNVYGLNSWCPYCSGNNKHSLNIINEWLVCKPNGKCLSIEYVNNRTAMKWQCGKCNYIWQATWLAVHKDNNWCPKCANNAKPTMEFINNWILENFPNGKCLTKIYKNNQTKMEWDCGNNHKWNASWANLYNKKHWCPYCAKKAKYNLEFIKKWINENHIDGKCLSQNYVNNRTPLEWQCEKCNNSWFARWRDVHYHNNWCPYCSKLSKPTIQNIYDFLTKNHPGSFCLTESYKNNHTKMEWKCKHGHVWKSNWSMICNKKRWCPICSSGFNEKCCKYVFEKLFNFPFIKYKPNWMATNINDMRTRLELDGYCKELNIAFEYQGQQHYNIIQKFKGTEEKLNKQKQRDKLKICLCKQNNVKLIIIPYFDKVFTKEKLKDFIKSKCLELNIEIPNNYDDVVLYFNQV